MREDSPFQKYGIWRHLSIELASLLHYFLLDFLAFVFHFLGGSIQSL